MQIPTSNVITGRCNVSGVERVERDISVPTPSPAPEGVHQTQILPRPRRVDSPELPLEPVVARTETINVSSENQPGNLPRNPNRHNRFQIGRILHLSRFQFLMRCMIPKFGKLLALTLFNTHRKSTISQYQHCWSQFQKWVRCKNVKKIQLSTILRFLMHLVTEKNMSPKSTLVYKSALHLPLKYGFGILTDSPEFSMLSRAQFISNPPKKKLIPQWSIDKVLKLLESPKFNSPTTDIQDLFKKCLFLIALAAGNGVSEIAAFDRSSIQFLPNLKSVNISVCPGFLYKNQRLDHTPPQITIPALFDNNNKSHPLCPVMTLKKWLDSTSNFNGTSLFFDPKSNKKLATPRISSILCNLISAADPGKFPRAHDIRKVASSLAWTRGIPLNKIVENAFWKNPSTFVNKYFFNVQCSKSVVALLN